MSVHKLGNGYVGLLDVRSGGKLVVVRLLLPSLQLGIQLKAA